MTSERRAQAPRLVGFPDPGCFRLKLTKGGVFVGARIVYAPTSDPLTGEPLDRSWLWAGEINGRPDPSPSPEPTPRVWRIWHSGDRISEAEFHFLVADRRWSEENAPHLPEAQPTRAVDLNAIPPLF